MAEQKRKRSFEMSPKPSDTTMATEISFKICVGDIVKVKMHNEQLMGKVLFIGDVEDDTKVRYGIRLDEKKGKHDGRQGHRRYFRCAPEHGILVPRKQVLSVEVKQARLNQRMTIGDKVTHAFGNGTIRFIGPLEKEKSNENNNENNKSKSKQNKGTEIWLKKRTHIHTHTHKINTYTHTHTHTKMAHFFTFCVFFCFAFYCICFVLNILWVPVCVCFVTVSHFCFNLRITVKYICKPNFGCNL